MRESNYVKNLPITGIINGVMLYVIYIIMLLSYLSVLQLKFVTIQVCKTIKKRKEFFKSLIVSAYVNIYL